MIAFLTAFGRAAVWLQPSSARDREVNLDPARWLLQIGGFVVLGVYFLVTGLRPRRRGDSPHCRACDYDLSHHDAERCPECGAILSEAAVATGALARAPWKTYVGAGCLLVAASALVWGVTDALQGGRLAAHLPTSWLVQDARGASRSRVVAALDELMRRTRRGDLSDARVAELADACLTIQKNGAPAGTVARAEVLLRWLGENDGLSMQHWQRYVDNKFTVSLHLPPIVPVGQALYVDPTVTWRGDGVRFSGELTWIRLVVDGVEIDVPTGQTDQSGEFSLCRDAPPVAVELRDMGMHDIVADVEFSLTPILSDQPERVVGRVPRRLVVSTRAVETEAYYAEVDAALDDCLVLKAIQHGPNDQLKLIIEPVRPLPVRVKIKAHLPAADQTSTWTVPAGWQRALTSNYGCPRNVPQRLTVEVTLEATDYPLRYRGQPNANRYFSFADVPVERMPDTSK